MKEQILLLTCSILLSNAFISCKKPGGEHQESRLQREGMKIEFAEFFRVRSDEGSKVLQVLTSDKNVAFEYCLEDEIPCDTTNICLCVPVQSVGAMASSYFATLSALNLEDKITVIPDKNATHSHKIRTRVEKGLIKEVGNYNTINLELLVEANPEVVFSSYTSTQYDIYKQLSELSIPSVSATPHLERHPLGRAEWIKFFGTFFKMEYEADSIFNHIKAAYSNISKLSQNRGQKPKVMAGYYKEDAWVAPGGNSYFAYLLQDAGADYIYKDDDHSGNITLNIENTYVAGLEADIVIYLRMGSISWDDVIEREPIVKDWEAVKNGMIYSNDAQLNEYNRNNYWEQGFMEPHIILKDVSRILHPQTKENSLTYFRKIKQTDFGRQ